MIPSPSRIRSASDLLGVLTERDGCAERSGLRLRQVDGAGLGLEQVHRPLGDVVEHGGEVGGRRELAPDLGQRGHLVAATPGLLVQLRVPDRDAHVGGDRGEEMRVGLAEPALLLRCSGR